MQGLKCLCDTFKKPKIKWHISIQLLETQKTFQTLWKRLPCIDSALPLDKFNRKKKKKVCWNVSVHASQKNHTDASIFPHFMSNRSAPTNGVANSLTPFLRCVFQPPRDCELLIQSHICSCVPYHSASNKTEACAWHASPFQVIFGQG